MNNEEELAKRNLSDFRRQCQRMNKACGGGLDAYIISWISGDVAGTSACGNIDDIAALVATVIFNSVPEDYQLSVIEKAKEDLINVRIAHKLADGL